MNLKEYYKKVLTAGLVEESDVPQGRVYQSEIPVDRSYDDVETIRALRPGNQATRPDTKYIEPPKKLGDEREPRHLEAMRKKREADAAQRGLLGGKSQP